MKAIRVHRFGGPDVLEIEDVPLPRPGAGEVLIRIKAIGVNPVETYLRSGSSAAHSLPYTPGSDSAGIIEITGEGVTACKTGDRVYTSGTLTGAYADAAICRVEDVHPLPENITFEQGAAINIPYATAYRALKQRSIARTGETVLIHGASGGVGVAAVQIARAMGLTVIGTAGSEPGRHLVLEQGAHHCLDHTQDDYLDELQPLTKNRGPDIILEMLSDVNLANDTTVIARRGRIIVIGCRGKIEINPRELMLREADVRGLLLFNATPEELASIHAALSAGLENGTLRPIVGRKFPLADADAAHTAVLEKGAFGKIILVP
ncbi:MAG: NADPH:quinone reductase [Verrucomicrobiales bacterium]